MSNYHLQPADKPQALTPQALRSLRQDPVQGISRRTLLRRSIGGATLLWLTEVAAGSIGFLWPNARGGFGGAVPIGTIDDIKAARTRRLPFAEGFPVYYQQARAYIVLIDTSRQEFVPGEDTIRRRDGAQRPRAVPALPAPRLQAEPVPAELLAGVPVPRLALRPARHQGPGRPVRPGAARHGPLLDQRRRRRRAHPRHLEDHPRAAPDRRSASRGSSRRRAPSAAYDRRKPGPPRKASRSGASPRAARPASPSRAGRRTGSPRPATTRAIAGLTSERAAKIVRQSGDARWVAFLGVVIVALFVIIYYFYEIAGIPILNPQPRLGRGGDRSRPSSRSSAGTTSTRPTARAATASTARAASGRS